MLLVSTARSETAKFSALLIAISAQAPAHGLAETTSRPDADHAVERDTRAAVRRSLDDDFVVSNTSDGDVDNLTRQSYGRIAPTSSEVLCHLKRALS